MASYKTTPPTTKSSEVADATVAPKSKHIIAIRGPQANALYLAGAIKAYVEGPVIPTAEAHLHAAPKKTVEIVNEPTVKKIEITDQPSDLLIVIGSEEIEVVGASVIYDISVPDSE